MSSSLAPRFGVGPFLSGGAAGPGWLNPVVLARVEHGRDLFSRLHLCVSDRKMARKGDPRS